MKLNRYLTLTINESKDEYFIDIMRKIYKNCKPFLKEWAKPQKGSSDVKFLLSGRESSKIFDKRKIRKDRKPVDTHDTINNDLNDEFQRQFGYPARSNSIFCTSLVVVATTYGDPYMIFPIGKYKYLWNKNIHDLYNHIQRTFNGLPTDTRSLIPGDNPLVHAISLDICDKRTINLEFEKQFYIEYGEGGKGSWKGSLWIPKISWMDYNKDRFHDFEQKQKKDCYIKAKNKYDNMIDDIVSSYTDNNLMKALHTRNEIMISGNKYYMVRLRDGGLSTIESWFSEFGDKMPSEDNIKRWWYEKSSWGYSKLGIDPYK